MATSVFKFLTILVLANSTGHAVSSEHEYFAPRKDLNGNFQECGGISIRRQLNDVITWQSDAMLGTCLWDRRVEQSGRGGDSQSYWFHTGYAASFNTHLWLVIKLPVPILLQRITARFEVRHIQMLADTRKNTSLDSAAHGFIDVLVSTADLDFGSDHCSSMSVPPSIVEDNGSDSGRWKLCTTMLPPSQLLTADFRCTEPDGMLVRTLLLLKRISGENSYDRYMSFADLILRQAFYVSASARIVVQGQQLTVRCAACEENLRLSSKRSRENCLAHTDRQTKSRSTPRRWLCDQGLLLSEASVEPQQAGSYTCRHPFKDFDSTVLVRVLYGPKHLKIDYAIHRTLIDQSSNDSPVGEAQRKMFVKLEISFTSSSANPTPSHVCTAVINRREKGGQRNVSLSKSVTRPNTSGVMESMWLLHLIIEDKDPHPADIGVASVIVECSAIQSFEYESSNYHGLFRLHRRIQLQTSDTSATPPSHQVPAQGTVTIVCVASLVVVALTAVGLALSCRSFQTMSRPVRAGTGQSAAALATLSTRCTLCTDYLTAQASSRERVTQQLVPSNRTQQQQQQQPTDVVTDPYDEPVLYIN